MSDYPGPALSPVTPSLFAKIVLSAIAGGLLLGFGLLSASVLRNIGGVNSPAEIAGFEVIASLIMLSGSTYLLRSAFAWVEVTSREVICKSPLGTKRIPIQDIDLVEFYLSKNGANLKVAAGRRLLLLGPAFSERALRKIQGEIVRAGADMSKTIATQAPQLRGKDVVSAMSVYGLLIVFGGLGLILYLVYRALGNL